MKELYNRPVCLISIKDGIGKGSGRSIYGIPLGEIILEALNLKIIKTGGGHDMAAGFTIDPSEINNFNNFLNDKVSSFMDKGVPRFSHIVTSVIPISACTLEIAPLKLALHQICLLYTSPSPRDATTSRMPSSA